MQLNRSGFTMIELLIVIAALGLLIAVALPEVGRQIQEYRLSLSGGTYT